MFILDVFPASCLDVIKHFILSFFFKSFSEDKETRDGYFFCGYRAEVYHWFRSLEIGKVLERTRVLLHDLLDQRRFWVERHFYCHARKQLTGTYLSNISRRFKMQNANTKNKTFLSNDDILSPWFWFHALPWCNTDTRSKVSWFSEDCGGSIETTAVVWRCVGCWSMDGAWFFVSLSWRWRCHHPSNHQWQRSLLQPYCSKLVSRHKRNAGSFTWERALTVLEINKKILPEKWNSSKSNVEMATRLM